MNNPDPRYTQIPPDAQARIVNINSLAACGRIPAKTALAAVEDIYNTYLGPPPPEPRRTNTGSTVSVMPEMYEVEEPDAEAPATGEDEPEEAIDKILNDSKLKRSIEL